MLHSETSKEVFVITKVKTIDKLLINIDKLSELDTHKLKPASVDLKRLSEVVDIKIVKKDVYMLRSKILKIKYIILLT